jgi:hypothetical protein
MLVPFVIDANSLAPDPAWTSVQLRACHNSLLQVWRQIGLLAHDGDYFEKSSLYQAIQKLPIKIRPDWMKLIQQSPLMVCNSWNGRVDAASLNELCDAVNIALVDDTMAEVGFDFSEDCDEKIFSTEHGEISVCRLISANNAEIFKKAISLSGEHISKNTPYKQVWDSRFKTFISNPIKNISIVDRFACSRHITYQTKSGSSGLERLLRLIDSDATGSRHVKLYSAITPEMREKEITFEDVTEKINMILNELPKHNIETLTINMSPNHVFKVLAHDRFFRFEKYVWDIGIGSEIFEEDFTSKRSSAALKTGNDLSYREVERELDRNPRTTTIRIQR